MTFWILKGYKNEQAQHKPNKELFGQGLATIASVSIGGLPATGAIARTSVNVNAGARTRLAAMIHAVFLLVMVSALAPLVSEIPTSVLAGVLLGTSLRIANPRSIREALTTTSSERIVYLVTAKSQWPYPQVIVASTIFDSASLQAAMVCLIMFSRKAGTNSDPSFLERCRHGSGTAWVWLEEKRI